MCQMRLKQGFLRYLWQQRYLYFFPAFLCNGNRSWCIRYRSNNIFNYETWERKFITSTNINVLKVLFYVKQVAFKPNFIYHNSLSYHYLDNNNLFLFIVMESISVKNAEPVEGSEASKVDHSLSESQGEARTQNHGEQNTKNNGRKPPKKEEKAPKKRGRNTNEDNKIESVSKKQKIESPVLEPKQVDFKICEKTAANGEKWNFKISSWNVAGIRAWCKKGGHKYITEEQPDIICLQETKCIEKDVPSEVKIPGYKTYWLSGEKKGYSGVALYSKQKPLEVTYGMGKKDLDNEGRLITAEYDKFYLVATYVPNAGQGLKTLPKRLNWDKEFREYLKKLDAKKPVILTGDLNVAHEPIDLANPKTNTRSAGFTQEERDGMTEMLKLGFVDTFRHLYPEKVGAYTYWTYIGNARSRNTGWRLDYFILSKRLVPNLCDNVMRSHVMGSDHCPITLFLHI